MLVFVLVAGCGVESVDREPGLNSQQTGQFLEVQQSLAREHATLSQGRDQLEQDRRAWESRERRDPLVANSIQAIGLLSACVLPLALVITLLWSYRGSEKEDPTDSVLVEYLQREAEYQWIEQRESEVRKLPAPSKN